MNRLRALVPFAPLALAACVSTPPMPGGTVVAASAPRFDPLAFFAGRLDGIGTLDTIRAHPVATRVESVGHVDRGTLVLDQTVHQGTKPPRTRVWHIRQDAPGHYAGTLSDAAGPVAGPGPVIGDVQGNRLHLAFAMKGGLHADQWLTLAPDGRHAANLMKVRKLGLVVGILTEDIRRE